MEISQVIDKLHQLRYFEGYPDAAIKKALNRFRKNYRDGVEGSHSELFKRFPALALQVTDVDGELDGADDLKFIFRQLASSTFGIFSPRSISVKEDGDTLRLKFSHSDKPFSFQMDCENWIPESFYTFLRKVMKKECDGLGFQGIIYPDPGQSEFFVLCNPRAYRALTKAKLVPQSLDQLQSSGDVVKVSAVTVAPSKAVSKKLPNWAPPVDLDWAERLRLYQKGKWNLPTLSARPLANWSAILNCKVGPQEQADRWRLIVDAFDLMCAIHFGLTGIGKASDYAKLIVELAHQYLFGSWRKRYMEDDIKFTEEMTRQELDWEDAILLGSICALGLNDKPMMQKFLKFLDYDVYNFVPESTALFRLLADWVLDRKRWDWNEQSKIIKARKNDKYICLLDGLSAVKNADAAKLQHSLRGLGWNPRHGRPPTFASRIESGASLLVMLAEERGLCLPDPPMRLRDCLLDRKIFDD